MKLSSAASFALLVPIWHRSEAYSGAHPRIPAFGSPSGSSAQTGAHTNDRFSNSISVFTGNPPSPPSALSQSSYHRVDAAEHALPSPQPQPQASPRASAGIGTTRHVPPAHVPASHAATHPAAPKPRVIPKGITAQQTQQMSSNQQQQARPFDIPEPASVAAVSAQNLPYSPPFASSASQSLPYAPPPLPLPAPEMLQQPQGTGHLDAAFPIPAPISDSYPDSAPANTAKPKIHGVLNGARADDRYGNSLSTLGNGFQPAPPRRRRVDARHGNDNASVHMTKPKAGPSIKPIISGARTDDIYFNSFDANGDVGVADRRAHNPNIPGHMTAPRIRRAGPNPAMPPTPNMHMPKSAVGNSSTRKTEKTPEQIAMTTAILSGGARLDDRYGNTLNDMGNGLKPPPVVRPKITRAAKQVPANYLNHGNTPLDGPAFPPPPPTVSKAAGHVPATYRNHGNNMSCDGSIMSGSSASAAGSDNRYGNSHVHTLSTMEPLEDSDTVITKSERKWAIQ